MSEERFHDPSITLSKIYTKTGDEGKTSLVGGQRVLKDSARIEAYGDVDELNASLGMALATLSQHSLSDLRLHLLEAKLLRVQNELFNLGSMLATRAADLRPGQPVITEGDVTRLESEMDEANEQLMPLESFVLPGGHRLNAELHLCRTICRRAERRLVSLAAEESVPPEALHYLNRLSDAFFVWSRLASHALQAPERLWDPNFGKEFVEEETSGPAPDSEQRDE